MVVKKVLLLTVILTLLLTGSALAAPLDDYSKAGNVGISLFIQRSEMKDDMKVEDAEYTSTFDVFDRAFNYGEKGSLGGELTVSIAKGLAFSFEYLDSKNKQDHHFSSYGGGMLSNYYLSSHLKSHNFKLKYQAYKSDRLFIAPYLGVSLNKTQQSNIRIFGVLNDTLEHSITSKRKTSALAGVTLVYGLDKDNRLKTYFDGSVGNKVYSWNLGLAYGVSKNLDLDFGYRYYKSKDMSYDFPRTDVTTPITGSTITVGANSGKISSTSKGIYLGISYKFK